MAVVAEPQNSRNPAKISYDRLISWLVKWYCEVILLTIIDSVDFTPMNQ